MKRKLTIAASTILAASLALTPLASAACPVPQKAPSSCTTYSLMSSFKACTGATEAIISIGSEGASVESLLKYILSSLNIPGNGSADKDSEDKEDTTDRDTDSGSDTEAEDDDCTAGGCGDAEGEDCGGTSDKDDCGSEGNDSDKEPGKDGASDKDPVGDTDKGSDAEDMHNAAQAKEVVALVNEQRAAAGLNSLSYDEELTKAAIIRANEIRSYFSHTRPDGSAWSTVSAAARAENIAYGQRNAAQVMNEWMASSGHRANILRSGLSKIGVACVENGGTLYWVQLFG